MFDPLFFTFFIAITLSCLFITEGTPSNIHLNQLKLNGEPFYESSKVSGRTTEGTPFLLNSTILTFEFSKSETTPDFHKCFGTGFFQVPKDTDTNQNRITGLERFLMFDCTSISCQHKIEAFFFETRTFGVHDLNEFNRTRAEIYVQCETMGIVRKNIYWSLILDISTLRSIKPGPRSRLDDFTNYAIESRNEATSQYAITPFHAQPLYSTLIFAREVEDAIKNHPYVLLAPRFIQIRENGAYDLLRKDQISAETSFL